MNREELIFYLLADSNRPLTTKYLAKILERSVRTIKYDMKKVALLVQENGGVLKSKRGVGYWIEVNDIDIFNKTLYQLEIRESLLHTNNEILKTEHIKIMQYLITQKDYFKIEDISDKFYISKKVVNEAINYYRDLLDLYQLKVISKPNCGSKIVGSEFSIRLVMLYLFQIHFHKVEYTRNIKEFYNYFENDITEIKNTRYILLATLRNNNFSVNDFVTQILSRYLILQKNRKLAGYNLSLDEKTISNIKEFKTVVSISTIIFKKLSHYYEHVFDDEEVYAFAILLLTHRDLTTDIDFSKEYSFIWNSIVDIVSKLLSVLSNTIKIDNDINNQLYEQLLCSLLPIVVQLKFNINLNFGEKSKLYFMNNEKYKETATFMSNIFKKIMYDDYNTKVPDVLLKKLNKNFLILLNKYDLFQKSITVNILVSSNHGILSAENIEQMLVNFLNPDILGNIYPIELYEGRNFSAEEIDLYVLEDIDALYYDYSWPLVSIDSNDFHNDFKGLLNVIYEISRSKSNEKF